MAAPVAGRWWRLLRTPLIVSVAFAAVVVPTAIPGVQGWLDDRSLQARGIAVAGTVEAVDPDAHEIIVSYVPPGGTEPTLAEIDYWDGVGQPLRSGEPVTLQVDPLAPTWARVAGDHYPIIPLLTGLLLLAALPVTLLALRLRHARRAERLAAADDVPTFQLLGRLGSPGPRPELELFPLDDPRAAGPPLAVVPLLDPPLEPLPVVPAEPAPVQAKGQVRPYGLIVARAGDETLWPAAPARR